MEYRKKEDHQANYQKDGETVGSQHQQNSESDTSNKTGKMPYESRVTRSVNISRIPYSGIKLFSRSFK